MKKNILSGNNLDGGLKGQLKYRDGENIEKAQAVSWL